MGTNFYWARETNDHIDEDEDKVMLLRNFLNMALRDPDGDSNLTKAEEVLRRTGDPPKPIEVTLPNGEVVMSDEDKEDPRIHLGKRSAAGLYCFDCDVTLYKDGPDRIHYDHSGWYDACYHSGWYDACPKCGNIKKDETLGDGATGVELGFVKPKTIRPQGVRSCSSFSWAQLPEVVLKVCQDNPDEILVVDEYGQGLSGQKFVEMLDANCPLRFMGSIGAWFC